MNQSPVHVGEVVLTDGGRAAAGYSIASDAGDCFVRAVALAADLPYGPVYETLAAVSAEMGGRRSGRDGVTMKVAHEFMKRLGWQWTPTMTIGSGCTVHLRADELPSGQLVTRLSKHFAAMVDGVVHDNHDCTRDGTRCVYGYWSKP
jgi:hypothetical protein